MVRLQFWLNGQLMYTTNRTLPLGLKGWSDIGLAQVKENGVEPDFLRMPKGMA
jgi:hypothetical protein